MKTKKFSKKFDLNKATVANLNENQQKAARGGNSATVCMATNCVSYCITCYETCLPTCAVSPAACAVITHDDEK